MTDMSNFPEFFKSLLPRIKEQNKNWWINLETGEPIKPPIEEKLILVYTELAEAVEAFRKDLNDDHLPHRKGIEVELADAVIRWLDIYNGYDMSFKIEFPDRWYESTLIGTRTNLELLMNIFNHVDEFYDFEEKVEYNYFLFLITYFCDKNNLDLKGAIIEKLDYNMTRKDHTIEARKEKNGKKF